MLLLIGYVVIYYISDDAQGIVDLKYYLQKYFQTKDLESLLYFLCIEIARSKKRITFSKRKYMLDMLSKTGML